MTRPRWRGSLRFSGAGLRSRRRSLALRLARRAGARRLASGAASRRVAPRRPAAPRPRSPRARRRPPAPRLVWIAACSAGFVGCCFAVASRRVACCCCCSRCFALRFCRVRAIELPFQRRLSAFPCAGCGARTSGRTCASRCDPDRYAGSCRSGSCGACTPRKRGSPRFELLRVPYPQEAGGAGGRRKKDRAPPRGGRRIAPAGARKARSAAANEMRALARGRRPGPLELARLPYGDEDALTQERGLVTVTAGRRAGWRSRCRSDRRP